jgi:transmembrane sensor
LVEGSVELIKDNRRQMVKPGQQVAFNKSGQFSILEKANISETIAWKSKEIKLTDAPIEKVRDQIQRVYNVEITYQADIYYHFNIDIPPNTPLSSTLEILSLTGEVGFKVDGRKIIVTK